MLYMISIRWYLLKLALRPEVYVCLCVCCVSNSPHMLEKKVYSLNIGVEFFPYIVMFKSSSS